MASVEILDRSSMVERLKRDLAIDAEHTAIVTIDMHRGHLDPAVATMPAKPEDCRRVIASAERCLNFARGKGIRGAREAGVPEDRRPGQRGDGQPLLACPTRDHRRGEPPHPGPPPPLRSLPPSIAPATT